MATDALITSWQIEPAARQRLYERVARRIKYYQQRNALARACHRRTTIKKLQRIGIKLSKLPRCDNDTS